MNTAHNKRVFLSCPTEGADELIAIAREVFKKYGLIPYLAAGDKRYDTPIFDKIMPMIEIADYAVGIILNEVSTDVLEELAYAEAYATVLRMVEKGTSIGGLTARKEYEVFTRATFRESMENVCRFILAHATEKARRADAEGVGPSGGTGPAAASGSPQHLVHGPGPSSIGGHVVSSDPAPAWFGDDGMYAKMAADDLGRTLGYGSTWGFFQERIRVANRAAWIMATIDTDTGFILSHMASLERPTVPAATCVLQMAQVSAGVPDVIEGDLLPAHAKSFRKTLRFIMGGDRSPEYVQSDGSMAWAEKYLGSALRKACLHTPGLDPRALENNLSHEIISHNFLQPAHLDEVPAVRAGSPRFAIMRDIYDHGASGEKGFLVRLGKLMDHTRVIQYPKHGLVHMAIKDVDVGARLEIEAILTECGFRRKRGSWTRKLPSPPSPRARFDYPEKTFDVCNRCGRVALSMQEIVRLHGLRNDGGRLKTQPTCRQCRNGTPAPKKRFRQLPARLHLDPRATLDPFTCRPPRKQMNDAFSPRGDRYWSTKRGRQTRLR